MERSDEELVEVVLEGGPGDLARTALVDRLVVRYGCLKIERLGGYEHFERIGPGDGSASPGPVVFRWSERTRIAE